MKTRSSLNNRIDNWLRRRPWKRLWFCLPALLAGGVLLAVLVLVLSRHTTELNARYDNSAVKSLLASGKYEEARVACLHGLADIKDNRARAQRLFYLAGALGGLGRLQDAAQLMDVAAPLDHPGCAEAHLLVAQTLLSSTNLSNEAFSATPLNVTNATTEILHRVERHLLNALALEPQSLPANELLGRFYLRTQNPAKAKKYLMQIYSRKPDIALLLAFSCVQTNDQAGALQWADRAIAAFEQKLLQSAPHYRPEDRFGLVQAVRIKQKYAPSRETVPPRAETATNTPPQDSPAFWLHMVHLLVNNGKYAPALDTLDQQMLLTTNPVYASTIADICAVWAGSIPPAQKGGSALRLQLIQKGLANVPQHLALQLLLAQVSHATDDTGPAAKKLLDDSIAIATNAIASAWWHFVLWTDDRIRGDLPAARKHLQTAYQLAPQIPPIKNDLALDLSTGSREDQERGLKLIQSLVDQFPYHPNYRGTRGLILAKLGRNEEALKDLEFAAPRERAYPPIQQALAKAYAALGRTAPAPQVHSTGALALARDLANKGKYAEALAKLEPEMRQSPNPAYAAAIADICATWLGKIPASQSAERLRLLQTGLGYDPQHTALMALLLQATHVPGDSGQAAQKLLDQLVASAVGDAAAEWHLFVGQDDRARGDLPTARQQLQNAFALAPERTDIKSALAAVLVAGNRDDWQQGLQFIQPALDQFPENPEFRNTRGLLLARLGQNKAAAADLEFAVAKLPDPTQSRLELAKIYDLLGNSKSAEQQRRLAASPRKQ